MYQTEPSFTVARPGLEWVDDQTCVLVFGSRKSALQAWDALRSTSHGANLVTDPGGDGVAIQVDDTNDESFSPAPPLPLALYPIEERINSVLGENGYSISTMQSG